MAKRKIAAFKLSKVTYLLIALLIISIGLFVYRLGSITPGVSLAEQGTAKTIVGFHGIYHNPLFLPIKLVRSVIFNIGSVHSIFALRLANVIFGTITVLVFFYLVKLWHNLRVAVMASIIFCASAWTLHITRYASDDIVYYWAIPTIFLLDTLFQKYPKNKYLWYGAITLFGVMLYVPGLVWFIALDTFLIWPSIVENIKGIKPIEKIYSLILGLVLVSLLVGDLFRSGQFIEWLGLPNKYPSASQLIKNVARVPYHLFARGPYNPELWVGKLPILDIFSLVTCLIGIYYYARHYNNLRSKLLGLFGLIGWALVILGGAFSLSGLVVILFLLSASGIAYLLKEWLEVFPNNPIARATGVVLLSLVILLAVYYNTRSYFVAWADSNTTHSVFHYHD